MHRTAHYSLKRVTVTLSSIPCIFAPFNGSNAFTANFTSLCENKPFVYVYHPITQLASRVEYETRQYPHSIVLSYMKYPRRQHRCSWSRSLSTVCPAPLCVMSSQIAPPSSVAHQTAVRSLSAHENQIGTCHSTPDEISDKYQFVMAFNPPKPSTQVDSCQLEHPSRTSLPLTLVDLAIMNVTPSFLPTKLIPIHALQVSVWLLHDRNAKLHCIADCAADLNCISESEAIRLRLSLRSLHQSEPRIQDGSSNQMTVIGALSEPLQLRLRNSKGLMVSLTLNSALVIRDLVHPFILGSPFLHQHGLAVDMKFNRILQYTDEDGPIQNLFPGTITESVAETVCALQHTGRSVATSTSSSSTPSRHTEVQPVPLFPLIDIELAAGEGYLLPLFIPNPDYPHGGAYHPKNDIEAWFEPDIMAYVERGLISTAGILDPLNPRILITNSTVHPVHIDVDQCLGSLVPHIRVTDKFVLRPEPPSQVGPCSSSTAPTDPILATIPISTEDQPEDPLNFVKHVPGTFQLDLAELSPTDTTSPDDVAYPKTDPSLPQHWQDRFNSLKREYYKIFIKDFSAEPWLRDQALHEIELYEGSRPYAARAFRLPEAHRLHMKEVIEKWIEEKVLVASNSPWAAPAFVVPKPHGGGYRMVVDYRKLNSMTIPDRWPLPLPETLFSNLHGAEIFSTFDAHSGFTQQALHPNSQAKTSFICDFGQFEFTRLSMGLRNGPSSFSRGMYLMCKDLNDMLVYIDDVNVFSKRPTPSSPDDALLQRHYDSVHQFFQRCLDTNLRLNGKKCTLGAAEIGFLGHIVSAKGLQPDPEKVKAVASMRPPTNASEIRTFLGMINYYRGFIKDIAQHQVPLNKLLHKEAAFIWSTECQTSFEFLRQALVNECLRRFPDNSRPFELHTDASAYAIGGVLMQRDDANDPYPIEFYSRSLTASEYNYAVFEKEALAIIACFRKFHVYLAGAAFNVYTDHRALASLMTMKDPTRRIARWLVTLGEYSFTAIYRKGILNTVPDALSRLPSENVTCPSIVSRGDGTMVLNNFPEEDYLASGFEYPQVTLPNGVTMSTLRYTITPLMSRNSSSTASSVATPQSSEMASSEAHDEPTAFESPRPTRPDLESLDLSRLDNCQKLIGMHFIDSDDNLEYIITDIWFDDVNLRMVGSRSRVLPDFDPTNAWPQLEQTEDSDDEFVLDYFIRELRSHPPQTFTPHRSYHDIRDHNFLAAVEESLAKLIKNGRIRDEQILLINDEFGYPHYYRRTHLPPHFTYTLQLIIPQDDITLQTVFLNSCHQCSGHSKVKRTYHLLQQRVWWYGMKEHTTQFVQACQICAKMGSNKDRYTPEILRLPSVTRPWQRVSIDTMGPLPDSLTHNKYVVLAVDHFTKYVIGTALSESTALAVAHFLIDEVFFKYGAPDIILTDNGSEYKNELEGHILTALGTHHRFIAAYHPCANGQVERLNAPVKSSIASLCNDHTHKDWDQHLAPAIFAYNISVHETTGFTPFFLNHGRECRLQVDALSPPPKMKNTSHMAFVYSLIQRLRTAHYATESKLDHAHSLYNKPRVVQQALHANNNDDELHPPFLDPPPSFHHVLKQRKIRLFKVGDKVLVFVPSFKRGNSNKLTKHWKGPYDVVKVVSPVIYHLQRTGTQHKIKVVHVSRIKAHHNASRWT